MKTGTTSTDEAACLCKPCEDKRFLFCECLRVMAGGIGHAKKTIQRRIIRMPDNFITDLRQLMSKLRQSPEVAKELTPLQHRILKSHRLPLRYFTKSIGGSEARTFLSAKRRLDGNRVPLAQAIGRLLASNSKFVNDYVNDMTAHPRPYINNDNNSDDECDGA